MTNLKVLAALIHGIYCDVMFDIFQEILIGKKILNRDLSNRDEILHEFIYERYIFSYELPKMQSLKYAYSDQGPDLNSQWWEEMKVQMRKFIQLIHNLLEESNIFK